MDAYADALDRAAAQLAAAAAEVATADPPTSLLGSARSVSAWPPNSPTLPADKPRRWPMPPSR
ncbi:hypothetical protein ACQP1G_00840 [Nocardia sp. CA-107356]|uniref:hypothetical protein n=1 Tax=Nocardia sp. CA-107356 TaxID=3239972 RepID=UPI003D914A24